MSTPIKGGCLCGAVTYDADVPQAQSMSCYCRDCQCATGSTCATFVTVPDDAWNQEGEASSYTSNGESGGEVTRWFCGTCGAQLWATVASFPGARFVKVGTLEDANAFKPAVHIWTERRASWVELPEGALAFAKNPQTP